MRHRSIEPLWLWLHRLTTGPCIDLDAEVACVVTGCTVEKTSGRMIDRLHADENAMRRRHGSPGNTHQDRP